MTAGTATDVWFGPVDRSLHGWLHVPEGGVARGAVVLCPPVGNEQIVSQLTLRMFAEHLAAHGIAALRFDYPGTCDSAGAFTDPDLAEQWITSTGTAVQFVRDCGVHDVAVVGLRMGATLASVAADRGYLGETAGLVLWDPIAKGRTFIRKEHSTHLVSSHRAADDSDNVEGPGFVYSADLAAALADLTLVPNIGVEVLVAVRSGSSDSQVRRFTGVEPGSIVEVDGMPQLFDVVDMQSRVPMAAVDTITSWLTAHLVGPSTQVRETGRSMGVVDASVTPPIVERFVTLGESQLAAVVCEREGNDGPFLFMTSTAMSYHVGQARIWTALSRELARRGVTCVRVDNDDIGDSPLASVAGPRIYRRDSVTQLSAAIADATKGREGTAVATIGLSSGAWMAAEVGFVTPLTATYLINPLVWEQDPPSLGITDPIGAQTGLRQAWARFWESPIVKRLNLGAVSKFAANTYWKLATIVGRSRGPIRVLRPLVDRGTRVTVFMGTVEQMWFRRGSTRSGRRWLARTPEVRLVTYESLDHSLMTAQDRHRVLGVLLSTIPQDLGASERLDHMEGTA